MPKKRRKDIRKGADTIRVQSLPRQQGASRRIGALVVVQGADVDLGRHVLCDRPITIGRDEAVELSLSDGSISRRHCRVERDDQTGQYVLVDLGSTNGTSVNDHHVEQQYPLAVGDKIYLGASVVRFSFSDAVDVEFHSKVEEMVTTDPLTGLGSRRQYDAVFEAMASKAKAEGSLLTILVMDMDGLKQINDTHGHEMGGFAIVEVSNIIRDVLEKYGALCRFGGDEFVGCFAGLERDQAVALAEDVRNRVAAHNFVNDGIRVEPTVSIGVATFPTDTADPTTLFSVADRALYRAKRLGRNRVSTAADDASA